MWNVSESGNDSLFASSKSTRIQQRTVQTQAFECFTFKETKVECTNRSRKWPKLTKPMCLTDCACSVA